MQRLGFGVPTQVEGKADATDTGERARFFDVVVPVRAPAVDEEYARPVRRPAGGAVSVPSMRCSSTTMSTVSVRTFIRFDDGVLGDRTRAAIDAAEMHGGAVGRFRIRVVRFGRARVHDPQSRVITEGGESRDLRTARAADAQDCSSTPLSQRPLASRPRNTS